LLYDRIQDVFHRIAGTKQENELFNRAETSSDAVCFFIASHIKERDLRRSIRLYERLARSSQPLLALSAKHILSQILESGD
jgi:hypothetical protein